MIYALKIIWLLENKLIFAKYEQINTYDELAKISDTMTRLLDESQAPMVHIIDDVSAVEALPKLADVQKNIHYLRHERLGWYVTTLELPPLIKMISNIVTRMMNVRYCGFLSPEDALRFLKRVDPTLRDVDILIKQYDVKIAHLEQFDADALS